jgi:hypothetical protein
MIWFVVSALVFVCGKHYLLHKKYKNLSELHEASARFWRNSMLEIAKAHIDNYVKTPKNKVCLQNNRVAIIIGGEDREVPVNMELVVNDPRQALDEAYNRFADNYVKG